MTTKIYKISFPNSLKVGWHKMHNDFISRFKMLGAENFDNFENL